MTSLLKRVFNRDFLTVSGLVIFLACLFSSPSKAINAGDLAELLEGVDVPTGNELLDLFPIKIPDPDQEDPVNAIAVLTGFEINPDMDLAIFQSFLENETPIRYVNGLEQLKEFIANMQYPNDIFDTIITIKTFRSDDQVGELTIKITVSE